MIIIAVYRGRVFSSRYRTSFSLPSLSCISSLHYKRATNDSIEFASEFAPLHPITLELREHVVVYKNTALGSSSSSEKANAIPTHTHRT
ncbi:hypothetical protein TSAR_002282 [Trichomalopsis sarcophagae]|uniref:Uncharacterized protein n=1 Tax=Trichomalopsis sarcophagae TaxID=543379 RepID=A0A232FJ56_9HYME|nr:hypothetical protein TSAR_002282 [Trichomalopsis sarcophagae]